MRLRVAPFALLKRLALRLLLIAAVLWGGGIALFSVLPVPFSAVMLERQVSAWLSGDFHYLAHSDWVAMDKISPWMGLAVIAAEDQKFPEHWGSTCRRLRKRWRTMSGMIPGFAARQRCRSRRRKTCFYGMAAAGCVRGWKPG